MKVGLLLVSGHLIPVPHIVRIVWYLLRAPLLCKVTLTSLLILIERGVHDEALSVTALYLREAIAESLQSACRLRSHNFDLFALRSAVLVIDPSLQVLGGLSRAGSIDVNVLIAAAGDSAALCSDNVASPVDI